MIYSYFSYWFIQRPCNHWFRQISLWTYLCWEYYRLQKQFIQMHRYIVIQFKRYIYIYYPNYATRKTTFSIWLEFIHVKDTSTLLLLTWRHSLTVAREYNLYQSSQCGLTFWPTCIRISHLISYGTFILGFFVVLFYSFFWICLGFSLVEITCFFYFVL